MTILSRIWPARRRAAVPGRRRARGRAGRVAGAAAGTARRRGPAGARRQGARGLERAGDRGLRRGRADCSGRSATRPRRCGRRRRSSDGLLAADGVAQAVVEGRPGGRSGRARGLRPPRRGAAGAVRDDVRRALVLDRARPRGPDPGAVRRSGGRLLRHRDDHERLITRPKDLQDNAMPVGWGDGHDGAAAAGGVDRGGALSRGRGTGARHGLAVPGALPDGVRAVARGRVVRGSDAWRWRSSATRRTPRPGSCSSRSGRRGGRTRCWPWRPRTARPRPRCRCCTTASPSTAVRRPTSAATSRATCRSPMPCALAEQLASADARPCLRSADPDGPAARPSSWSDRARRARGPAHASAGDDGVRARHARIPGWARGCRGCGSCLGARSVVSREEAAERLGGDLEPATALAAHIAAIREAFEEVGVLLADVRPERTWSRRGRGCSRTRARSRPSPSRSTCGSGRICSCRCRAG